jgi:type II secretory pathway component PulK
MKISPHKNSGIALLIAMIAVTVLSLLAAGLWYAMKVETRLAQNADSETQLYWLGRSGVEYARWILSQQASIAGEPYDSLNQKWAGGPGTDAESNSVLAGVSLDNYPVGDGTVSLKIIDLERKINVNTASPDILQQALTAMGVDADSISIVSDSIQDWIDTDDSPRLAGAESDYYQTLTPPYYAKNAPIDDLSELLLVKGVTPEMYDPATYGGSNTTASPFQHKLGFGNSPGQPPDYPFGLKDIFTPVSSGRVNINTADTNVLQALLGVDASVAAAIVEQRAGPDGVDGTEDDTPIRNVQSALQSAGVNQLASRRFGGPLATRSSTFEVHVTAKIGDYSREYIAILYRASSTDIEVYSFYWKDASNSGNPPN